MNHNREWHEFPSNASKAIKKFMKHGIASKVTRDELFYKYSSVLPSSQKETPSWNYVVDTDKTAELERLGLLNWWQMATKLHVIKIPQDKYSFFHSVSVSLWGVPDSKGLVIFLIKSTLKLHGRVWAMRFNKNTAYNTNIEGLKLNSERLLPDHIFVLCNVIQRPIIIISNENKSMRPDMNEDIATFGGIYLPSMSKPIDCSKTPIFLAYHNGLFSPLVTEVSVDVSISSLHEKYSICFPLVKSDFSMFHVMFLLDSEEIKAGEILQDYMIVKDAKVTSGDELSRLLFTKTECYTLPEDKNVILNFMKTFVQQPYNEKVYSHPKLFKNLKISMQSTIKNGVNNLGIHANSNLKNFQTPGDNFLPGKQELKDSGFYSQMDTMVGSSSSQYGILHHADLLPRVEPNAPEMPEDPQEPMSMTSERCVSCKNYRSSTKTFPFCHECFDQRNKLIKNESPKENFAMASQLNNTTIHTSVFNQQEKINNVSVAKPKSFSGSSYLNNVHKASINDNDIRTGVRNFPLSTLSPRLDNYSVEASCQTYSDQENITNNESKICASPVCKEKASYPELLCDKCIKILKVHMLSNCSKDCCRGLVPDVNVPSKYCHSDLSRDENIEMIASNTATPLPRKMVSEVENNSTDSKSDNILSCKCGINRSNSLPDSPSKIKSIMPRRFSAPLSSIQKDFSFQRFSPVSESPNEDERPTSTVVTENEEHNLGNKPRSLMVTSLTSVDETNHMLNIFSGHNGAFENNRLQSDPEETIVIQTNDTRRNSTGSYFYTKSSSHKEETKGHNFIPAQENNDSKQDKYYQTMENLENNLRKNARRCKSDWCSNYGSSEKDDYCNRCYNDRQRKNFHHHDYDIYEDDQCDGEHPPMDKEDRLHDEEEVDGYHIVDDSIGYHTMQKESTSDSSDFFLSDSDLEDAI